MKQATESSNSVPVPFPQLGLRTIAIGRSIAMRLAYLKDLADGMSAKPRQRRWEHLPPATRSP